MADDILNLTTHSPAETRALGAALVALLPECSLVALYGEPDSVRTSLSETDPTMIKHLSAYWAPMTPAEPWGLEYSVMEVRYQGVTVSSPMLSSAQCFWPDQAPKCPEVLKEP